MVRRVWTKQHIGVLNELTAYGRYVARGGHLYLDLQESARVVQEAYDWLADHHPKRQTKPPDAMYPIWLSYEKSATMLPGPRAVILELELESDLIEPIHVLKWGCILNNAYIPADRQDAERHRADMAAVGLSDAELFRSTQHPELKEKIADSWRRLFDAGVALGSPACYGTVWEIRVEWLIDVQKT